MPARPSQRYRGRLTRFLDGCGVLLRGLAAAFGPSAVLPASRVACDVTRTAGAAVPVWMGARALWRARRAGGAEDGQVQAANTAGRG